MVDAIHCLPEALISKKQWKPKTYWKIYIRPYREKWDKQFLMDYEKNFLKPVFLIFLVMGVEIINILDIDYTISVDMLSFSCL